MNYNIVIIGGGTAGWITAAYLSFHNPNKTICLIESPNIPTIGVGEGTFPSTMGLLNSIGITPRELLVKSNGGLKLGIQYTDFASDAFWLSTNAPQDWERWGTEMSKTLSLSSKVPPIDDEAVFACHFVAHDLAQLLKEHALKNQVTHISAEVVNSQVKNNQCDNITLDSGNTITADWFVDCSGFARVLIKQTDSKFVSYDKELLVDSAVVGPIPYTDKSKEFTCYSKISARTAGWQFKIPTYSRTGNGYVYSSQFLTPEAAETELRNSVPVTDIKNLKMTLGYYDQLIVGNIVAAGLSGGFIEPMEATAIHLTERTIIAFNDLLQSTTTIDAANQYLKDKIRYIKTLILAHYAFSKRTDPFWLAAREAAHNSAEIKEFFAGLKNGKFPTAEDDLDVAYPYCQWNELLAGFKQDHYYPTINSSAKKEIYMATYYTPNHFDYIEKLRTEL